MAKLGNVCFADEAFDAQENRFPKLPQERRAKVRPIGFKLVPPAKPTQTPTQGGKNGHIGSHKPKTTV